MKSKKTKNASAASEHVELWQREYILHITKFLDPGNEARINELVKDYDFSSSEAQMFKSGWDCCFHCANAAISAAMSEVGHE